MVSWKFSCKEPQSVVGTGHRTSRCMRMQLANSFINETGVQYSGISPSCCNMLAPTQMTWMGETELPKRQSCALQFWWQAWTAGKPKRIWSSFGWMWRLWCGQAAALISIPRKPLVLSMPGLRPCSLQPQGQPYKAFPQECKAVANGWFNLNKRSVEPYDASWYVINSMSVHANCISSASGQIGQQPPGMSCSTVGKGEDTGRAGMSTSPKVFGKINANQRERLDGQQLCKCNTICVMCESVASAYSWIFRCVDSSFNASGTHSNKSPAEPSKNPAWSMWSSTLLRSSASLFWYPWLDRGWHGNPHVSNGWQPTTLCKSNNCATVSTDPMSSCRTGQRWLRRNTSAAKSEESTAERTRMPRKSKAVEKPPKPQQTSWAYPKSTLVGLRVKHGWYFGLMFKTHASPIFSPVLKTSIKETSGPFTSPSRQKTTGTLVGIWMPCTIWSWTSPMRTLIDVFVPTGQSRMDLPNMAAAILKTLLTNGLPAGRCLRQTNWNELNPLIYPDKNHDKTTTKFEGGMKFWKIIRILWEMQEMSKQWGGSRNVTYIFLAFF